MLYQGKYGESEKVKWRGTWVVKTVIKRQIQHPVDMCVNRLHELFCLLCPASSKVQVDRTPFDQFRTVQLQDIIS